MTEEQFFANGHNAVYSVVLHSDRRLAATDDDRFGMGDARIFGTGGGEQDGGRGQGKGA